MLNCISSVSYTHLDVYKRQVHYSTKNENSIDMLICVNGLPVVAVSYTHLDVYKRQDEHIYTVFIFGTVVYLPCDGYPILLIEFKHFCI